MKNEDSSICGNMCVTHKGDCPLSEVGISLWGCPEKIAKEKEEHENRGERKCQE